MLAVASDYLEGLANRNGRLRRIIEVLFGLAGRCRASRHGFGV